MPPRSGLRSSSEHAATARATCGTGGAPSEPPSARTPSASSHVDWSTTLDADGTFLPEDALRALFGDPDPGQTLVTYCQTGSRASVDWLVLATLGYEDVRLYDGSWAEWGSDPELPIER